MAPAKPRSPHRRAARSAIGITAPRGFRAGGTTCGIKESGNPDLALILADRPCAAAGVFTVNKLPSAPVIVGRRHLRGGTARAIICNSGNANASTGRQGEADALRMCELVGEHLGVPAREVLPSSTGVIGRPLPMDKIGRGIATLAARLGRGRAADAAAPRAIMTTDLVPKTAGVKLRLGRATVALAGIAKGSGMIAPNMATLLAFLTTDAAVAPPALAAALRSAAAASFNRISVDQHTSPSDSLIALASGAAGNGRIRAPTGRDYEAFLDALTGVCRDLAYQVVKDGEGATKVFRIRVKSAKSARDADRIGRTVVDSPLVKTAVHGGDPNWGRITTAAGYSGAAVRAERMSLHVGPQREVCVYEHGQPAALRPVELRKLHRLMRAKEVVFTLDIGLGDADAEWLGCDLSRQYIAINADYTT